MQFFPAILVNVLSMFFEFGEHCLVILLSLLQKTRRDIQDYYILNLRDPMYISKVMNAWMWKM